MGDSKNFYKHLTKTPVHGTGQGSCSSPAIWLLISSILMDCLSKLGNGLTMQDVMGTEFSLESLRQWIDGFVDNTSLFTNITRSFGDTNDIRELTNRLRQDMIAWKDLLKTSGGKLELKKCFYYILSWKFDDKGSPSPTTITEQRALVDQITIPDMLSSIPIAIEQKDVITEHKTLGCFKSITGTAKIEME
jgi:hypothetical protein